jgi:predicted acetyltransferase
MPELALPRVAVVPSFVAATRHHGGEDHPDYDSAAATRAEAHPLRYVEALLHDVRERTDRIAGWVPSTHLWWVEGEEYLGRLQIRHRLNDFLREQGGHVGYYVVPDHRRKGHATSMFGASLPVAFALGIDCALVTCDHDNIASRRVIERHGGLLQDQRGAKLRYWVPTS